MPRKREGGGDFAQARALYQKGDPDAAADVLEGLLEREGPNVEVLLLLARCYSRMRLRQDALGVLQEVLSLQPDNAEALALRGAEYYFADRFAEALADLERAVELAPGNVEARVRLAQLWAERGQFQQAQELLEQAEEKAAADQDALALVRMGQVYLAMRKRQTQEVLRLAEENRPLFRRNPYILATVLSNEAIVHARQRDYDRARAALVEALNIDPYFVDARALFGQIALLQRDYAMAAHELRQVVEYSDNAGAQVHYALASALNALGQKAEALEHYRAALKKGLSGFPAVVARLAVLLPSRELRIGLVLLLLAVIAAIGFRFLSAPMAVAVVAVAGVLAWQILRGML